MPDADALNFSAVRNAPYSHSFTFLSSPYFPPHQYFISLTQSFKEKFPFSLSLIPSTHSALSRKDIINYHTLRFPLPMTTVKPPNKGHIGTRGFVLYREVSFIRRLKCTGIIQLELGRVTSFIYREVSFIQSVLYWRFHCTWLIVKTCLKSLHG